MKKVIIIVFLVFTSMLIAQSKQALFIGNSITYMGDIPQKFESIADAFGDSVDVTLHTPGGTGIGDHVVSEILYEKVRLGIWDYFIIQPGSGESPGTSTPVDTTLVRIQTILDSVYYYNPYAQPLFYQISCRTWGNSAEQLVTYNESMDAILENVQYWSDNIATYMAPVGEVLRTLWNENQQLLFWMDYDDIHLNERGSYLAACVFYATIFQKPSLGTEYLGGLDAEIAAEYQSIADEITLNNFSDWRINTYNLWVDYQLEQTSNQISLTNLSHNLDDWLWDFGDGSTSDEYTPEHQYEAEGIYQITLEANVTFNSGAEAVIEKTMQIEVSEIIVSAEPEINEQDYHIMAYPNPFRLGGSEFMKISFDLPESTMEKLEIFNTKGQLIRAMKINNEIGDLARIIWDGKDQIGKQVVSGVYFLKVSSGKYDFNKKIMVIK